MELGTDLTYLPTSVTFKFVRVFSSKYWIVENSEGAHVRLPMDLLITKKEKIQIYEERVAEKEKMQEEASEDSNDTVLIEVPKTLGPIEPEVVEEPISEPEPEKVEEKKEPEPVVEPLVKKPFTKSKIKEKIQKVVKEVIKKNKSKKKKK